MTDDDLVRLLNIVANELDDRGYPNTGIIRQGTRRLHELATRLREVDRAGHHGCQQCGAPLAGRQRQWCSESCRLRHHRGTNTDTVDRTGSYGFAMLDELAG